MKDKKRNKCDKDKLGFCDKGSCVVCGNGYYTPNVDSTMKFEKFMPHPQEKIEKLRYDYNTMQQTLDLTDKVNELIDAVNELREKDKELFAEEIFKNGLIGKFEVYIKGGKDYDSEGNEILKTNQE